MTFNPGDIVCVLVPNAVNSGYDYRLIEPARIGSFVSVSIMNRPYIGVVVGRGNSGLSENKIKNAGHVWTDEDFGIDTMGRKPPEVLAQGGVGLSESFLRWLYKMSEWTMMPPGAGLRLVMNVPDAFRPPLVETLYEYTPGGRMTESRQRVADAFSGNNFEPMSAHDIESIARVSLAVVKTMIDSNLLQATGQKIIEQAPPKYFDTNNVKLNDEQRTAADAIGLGQFSVRLLDGITGSGKTQVYFDAALRVYKSGKSVLIMMPEIALTTQFMSRFEKRFGAPPIVWHSNLTARRRREIWRDVAAGRARIIVGTRSALFLPWVDLGLIVVDEEHDQSYKQEDMGNYHARDMAVLRGHMENFPILLASATPSAETWQKVKDGAYQISKLHSRFGGAVLPDIEIVDMRKS